MKISKTVTKTYKISSIQYWGKYGEFVKQRKEVFGGDGKMKKLCKCFNCGHRFADDEDINAAFMIRHQNVFVCNECAKLLRESETANKE